VAAPYLKSIAFRGVFERERLPLKHPFFPAYRSGVVRRGLHPPKSGHAPFTVAFAIDADGILHLHAEEAGSGHSLTAHIERDVG
jgi:hypothetical protein